VKELDDVYHLPGMLTPAEVDCLFQLGQFNQRQGAIVEIGSWKGKSTVALARGSAKKTQEKIYAIDRTLFFLTNAISRTRRANFSPTSRGPASKTASFR
jgi:predicted O-methyltransferase YrrM